MNLAAEQIGKLLKHLQSIEDSLRDARIGEASRIVRQRAANVLEIVSRRQRWPQTGDALANALLQMAAADSPFDPVVVQEMFTSNSYGLVGVGGELSTENLLNAYRSGVFPWYSEGFPICWWSPDPRAIFRLESFESPRRLLRTLKKGLFQCTIDRAFAAVINGCATTRVEGTWITPQMQEAYIRLHMQGHAHSVETWHDGDLVGGIYGVSVGGFFAGESMFHQKTDASKAALVFCIDHLRSRGFSLFDIQIINDCTQRLGAVEISRAEYLLRLAKALRRHCKFGE
jgi:leucyl/phenylalanyl-tRNA--protein transferase